MDGIDAILYLNLAHRRDRKEHILNEIIKLCSDPSKIHRIDAIKRTPGALGCGLSHIKALQYAMDHPEWSTVLILEDDFTFKTDNTAWLNYVISKLLHHSPNVDMGLLSYNHAYFKGVPTMNPNIQKVMFSQTTSSYIIRRHYIPTLLQNFKEAMYDMERNGRHGENCIDIHWTRLQPMGNWYAIVPAIGYQYENFSDIEQCVTAYHC